MLGALRRGEASRDSPLAGGVALDVEARACAYECMLAFLQYARPARSAAGRFPRSVLRLAEGEPLPLAKGFVEGSLQKPHEKISPGLDGESFPKKPETSEARGRVSID